MAYRTLRTLVTVALIAAGLAGATSAVTAAIRPPKLDYQVTTLDNGLTLVTQEDHSTPIVHLQLWYHVGSRNEKPGRTGFAHLFEHLMFKGSKNVDPEGHTSMIASIGGQSNAYTQDDVTVFWETVPAQYLPLILWLEADRMATLKIDKETFTNERDVVKEERRMRVDNRPYYVPSNATLALVGDFDAAQAVQLVNQYLGRVPKAEREVPRDIPKEPP